MTDVDMTDAAAEPGPSKGKAPVKAARTAGADAGSEGKKRFEVKKVRASPLWHPVSLLKKRSGTPWLFGPGTSS